MWRPLGLHIIMVFFIRELNYMAYLPVPKTISAETSEMKMDSADIPFMITSLYYL